MDNVRLHHSKRVKSMLARVNCETIYIPPYTPEYNPIEMAFAQIKAHYYRASSDRPIEERALSAVREVKRSHCQYYFRFVKDEIAGRSDRLLLRSSVPTIRRYI